MLFSVTVQVILVDFMTLSVCHRIRPQLAKEKIEGCHICTFVTPWRTPGGSGKGQGLHV